MGYLNPHTHQLDTPARPDSDPTSGGSLPIVEDAAAVDPTCPACGRLHHPWCAPYGGPGYTLQALKQSDLDDQAGAALLATVRRSVEWLDAHNGVSEAETRLRILKVMEEAGEVAQAVIGAAGQNPRKGVTHTVDDIASELADVAITALVALHSLRHVDVAEVITAHTEKIRARFDTIKAPA